MKIYTKKGDDGSTQLFGGTRVSKHHLRVESYGTLDELNAQLGLLISLLPNEIQSIFFIHLQILLFDVGSHLATDPKKENSLKQLPVIDLEEIDTVEQAIDKMQDQLEPLKHFILPAGSQAIAQCHVCRTVCRRAERIISHLMQLEEVHPHILPLLNRLSDYFFVLARYIGKIQKIEEIKWMPRGK